MMNLLYKIIKPAIVCAAMVLLGGCASKRIVTTWKTDRLADAAYKKILVVAILPDKDSALRRTTENNFVAALQQLGYNASSALAEFGANGLSNSGQENTYLKLYNKGIEAVLTVALIHKTKQNFHRPGQSYIHPNSYYYKRIWDYKSIQAAEQTADEPNGPEYFWESILFDLNTLEAACTVRTQPFTKDNDPATGTDLSKKIIKKIAREKVLQKQKVQRAF